MDTDDPIVEEGLSGAMDGAAVEPVATAALGNAGSLVTWMDQDDLLRELWLKNTPPGEISKQLNRSVAAIMTRAARLGLPRRCAPGRKTGQRYEINKSRLPVSRPLRKTVDSAGSSVKDDAVPEDNTTPRICLMCLRKFPSAGRHNRICPSCKNSHEYVAGSRIPDINLSSV